MAFAKAKQVTYPLDDNTISRLIRPFSGAGSGESGQDNSSLHSELSHELFLDKDDDVGSSTTELASSSDFDEVESIRVYTIEKLFMRRSSEVDRYKDLLDSHVDRAMDVFSRTEPNKSDNRRKVMLLLQDIGHNATFCRTNWDSDRRIIAGSHEFIDVVSSDRQRYIVELDLAGDFEIARPTRQYSMLMQSMPRVFVGKIEEMKMIVKAIEAAKISVMSRDLTVSPWRNRCFMKNKRFGSYNRPMSPNVAIFSVNASVKCRSVGFNDSRGGVAVVHTR